MRRFLIIVFLWLLAGRVQAGQISLLAASGMAAPSNSATNFVAPTSSGGVWNATETTVEALFGGTGSWSLANWTITLTTAPGGSASWTFTVRKNEVDTALVVAISAANTTGSDTTHSVTFAPGDRISVKVVPATTPTTTNLREAWCFKVTAPSANQQPLVWGNGTALAAATTGYTTPQGITTTTVEADNQWPVPTAGTISALYVFLSADPGNGNTVSCTWRKAAADQAVTCTVTGNGTNGQTANDTTHSFSVAAGDLIDMKVVTSAAISNTPRLRWGCLFAPTTGSYTAMFGGVAAQIQNSTIFYGPVGSSSATESLMQTPLWACTAKNLYLDSTSSPPGGSATETVTVDKNTVAQTLTAQGTNSVPTGNDTTHTVAFADGDLFTMKNLNSASSGNTAPKWGLVLDVTQPAAGGNPAGSSLLTGVGSLPPSMRKLGPARRPPVHSDRPVIEPEARHRAGGDAGDAVVAEARRLLIHPLPLHSSDLRFRVSHPRLEIRHMRGDADGENAEGGGHDRECYQSGDQRGVDAVIKVSHFQPLFHSNAPAPSAVRFRSLN